MRKKEIKDKFPRLKCPSPKVFKAKGTKRIKKPAPEELEENVVAEFIRPGRTQKPNRSTTRDLPKA
ncbi:MAG TPA: hypothetical protein ACFYD3_00550 [Candidatus Hypogeohydataceae bacterium YC41]